MSNPNERFGADTAKTLHVALMMLSGWAISVLLPFRRSIGNKFLLCRTPFALVMPILFAIGVKNDSVLVVIPYFFVGLVFQAVSRARHGGDQCHSQYDGEPYVAMKLFRMTDEWKAKKVAEPILAALCGGYMLMFNPYLGMYWIGGAWAAAMTFRMQEYQHEQYKRQMRDVMIETQHFSAMARELRRGMRSL